MQEEVKNWFEQAKRDLISARNSLNSEDYYVASFLSQQAAEKALKAYLLKLNQVIPKVHDLVFLSKKAGMEELLINSCSLLTQIYIETRYPDLPGEVPADKFTFQISSRHINIAVEVIAWVEKRI